MPTESSDEGLGDDMLISGRPEANRKGGGEAGRNHNPSGLTVPR